MFTLLAGSNRRLIRSYKWRRRGQHFNQNHASGLLNPSSTALFLTILSCVSLQASAFHFYLHAGETRCFGESAPANSKILIEYTVSTGTGVMPVDLRVAYPSSAQAEQKSPLLEQNDVEHGKIAFVLPYADDDNSKHALHAEMHRRKQTAEAFSAFKKYAERNAQPHPAGHHDGAAPRRRLLSDESHPDAHIPPHHDSGDSDHHVHAEPHDHNHERPMHDDHHDFVLRGRMKHGHHDVGANADPDDYDDIDDDFEDLDMDNYDGISDHDLDEEQLMDEHRHKDHTRTSRYSDVDSEQDIFDTRPFEICLSNKEHRNDAHRRRVRLVIHKGETAHDYTRLAKKEHMSQLETSLQQISTELHQLMHELDHANQMESKLFRLNRETNRFVVLVSIVSLVIMFCVASFQSIYTKRFFKRKKVL